MNNLRCIYVPGLNDQHWLNRFLASFLAIFWKFFDIDAYIFSPRWRSSESYKAKERRLITLIDLLHKKGNQICLIGQSAGGSIVINAFSKRKDTVIGVINIAGRLRRGVNVFPTLDAASKVSSSFRDSVKYCEDVSIRKLQMYDLRRVMTIRPYWDEMVPSSTVFLKGARNDTVPFFEHALGGFGILLFYSSRLFKFMKNICTDKESVRKNMIARRKVLPTGHKKSSDSTIQRRLFERDEWKKAKTVCVYVSLAEEVDTRKIIAKLFHEKKRVVVPKISDTDGLKLYGIHSFSDVTQGSFGVLEPKENAPEVSRESIDLFIVPGLAFDRKGNRLGWGKGYYDRLLEGVLVPKIALAYSFQVVDFIPHGEYDIRMTSIITEKEVIDTFDQAQYHPE